MKCAWVENGIIKDICQHTGFTLDKCYHPSVAKLYDTIVPDEAQQGDGWINGKWIPRLESTTE